jgi:hypothetical protein
MSQSQLDKIEDTLNDLRDDLAVLIALSKSDVVEEASKIVVNEAYSTRAFKTGAEDSSGGTPGA